MVGTGNIKVVVCKISVLSSDVRSQRDLSGWTYGYVEGVRWLHQRKNTAGKGGL